MLEAVLVLAAVAAGVTGAWSPCGLSMVETLAPHGYAGSLRASLAACATFTAGALVGGIATFGGLALAGRALGAGSVAAVLLAAFVALAAAAGEARGARILPQIRRQVPESWRRVLPVPLAAGLYGILLGLGFTTFVLTFAVWALAAVCVALGDPAAGVLVGLAFGAGRALPVIVLAPANGTAWGIDAHAAMAERPAIYRGLRAVDAAALTACAAVLGTAPADAAGQGLPAVTVARGATDPSASGTLLAYDRPGASAMLVAGGRRVALPGTDPQVAGDEVAWREGAAVVIADATTLRERARVQAPGADALAFDGDWIAWRAGRTLLARPRGAGFTEVVHAAPPGTDTGPPSLENGVVAFHTAGPRRSSVVSVRLADGERRELRGGRGVQLLHPVLDGDELLYVRATAVRQELRIGPAVPRRDAGRDAILYDTLPTARGDDGRERGQGRHRHYGPDGLEFVPLPPERPPAGTTATLWSTALDAEHAYVTRVVTRGGRTTSTILRVWR